MDVLSLQSVSSFFKFAVVDSKEMLLKYALISISYRRACQFQNGVTIRTPTARK